MYVVLYQKVVERKDDHGIYHHDKVPTFKGFNDMNDAAHFALKNNGHLIKALTVDVKVSDE